MAIVPSSPRVRPDPPDGWTSPARAPQDRQSLLELARTVSIGSNVWPGAAAVVLPGVSVGDDSIIGAGSVVTRDIPSGVVAVGAPCRVVKTL